MRKFIFFLKILFIVNHVYAGKFIYYTKHKKNTFSSGEWKTAGSTRPRPKHVIRLDGKGKWIGSKIKERSK